MARNDAEECICGKICRPVVYIGDERIPLCQLCHIEISKSDIEWDRNITFNDLKARVVLLKNIKKHDKVHRALARGGRRKR